MQSPFIVLQGVYALKNKIQTLEVENAEYKATIRMLELREKLLTGKIDQLEEGKREWQDEYEASNECCASKFPVQPSILSGEFRAEKVCSTGNGRAGTIDAVFMPPEECNSSSVRQLFATFPDMTVRDLLTRVEKYTSKNYLERYCQFTTQSHEWRLILSTSDKGFLSNHRLFPDTFPVKDIPDWLFSHCHLLIDSTGSEGERARRNNKLEDTDLGSAYLTLNNVIESTKTSAKWEMEESYNDLKTRYNDLQKLIENTECTIDNDDSLDRVRNSIAMRESEYKKSKKEYYQLCADYSYEADSDTELWKKRCDLQLEQRHLLSQQHKKR